MSATGMTPILSAQYLALLDKRLKKVWERPFSELTQMVPMIFNVMSSDSAWEEFYGVSALPDTPEFNGMLEYAGTNPEYLFRIEPKEFAMGVQIERKFHDDKKYNVMSNWIGNLSESLIRTQEKYGVEVFANGWSAAYTFGYSEEGKALFSTTHTTKSGVSTSTGFSNSGTSALTKTNVAATRILMRKFKGSIGQRIEIDPDWLIVPDSLYDTACEIVGYDPRSGASSEKDPESANHKINSMWKRFKVVPWMRLDDYSTKSWYMVDSRQMKKHLYWLNRIPAEYKMTVDFENFMTKHASYSRWGAGFDEWRWGYGQQVT